MKKYYDNREDNIAFERCIDVMARLMLKYGPAFLKRMEDKRVICVIDIESAEDEKEFVCSYVIYSKAVSDSDSNESVA